MGPWFAAVSRAAQALLFLWKLEKGKLSLRQKVTYVGRFFVHRVCITLVSQIQESYARGSKFGFMLEQIPDDKATNLGWLVELCLFKRFEGLLLIFYFSNTTVTFQEASLTWLSGERVKYILMFFFQLYRRSFFADYYVYNFEKGFVEKFFLTIVYDGKQIQKLSSFVMSS